MTQTSDDPQQEPPMQSVETSDSEEETPQVLSPSEQIAQYLQERRTAREILRDDPESKPLQKVVDLALGVGVLALLTMGLLFGLSLLFKGCAYLGERSKENEGRALLCNAASEDLDQVKRLRDNGFASESAVRVMERKHDQACTW